MSRHDETISFCGNWHRKKVKLLNVRVLGIVPTSLYVVHALLFTLRRFSSRTITRRPSPRPVFPGAVVGHDRWEDAPKRHFSTTSSRSPAVGNRIATTALAPTAGSICRRRRKKRRSHKGQVHKFQTVGFLPSRQRQGKSNIQASNRTVDTEPSWLDCIGRKSVGGVQRKKKVHKCWTPKSILLSKRTAR